MFVPELMMYLLPRISLIQNCPSLNNCDYQTGKCRIEKLKKRNPQEMTSNSTLTGKYNSVLLQFATFSFFLSKDQSATSNLRFVQPQLLSCTADQKSTTSKFPGAISRIA
jgi:hypothetical protein